MPVPPVDILLPYARAVMRRNSSYGVRASLRTGHSFAVCTQEGKRMQMQLDREERTYVDVAPAVLNARSFPSLESRVGMWHAASAGWIDL